MRRWLWIGIGLLMLVAAPAEAQFRKGVWQGTSNFCFEGATADANELCFTITDPTADRVITFPDDDLTLNIVPGSTVAGLPTATAGRMRRLTSGAASGAFVLGDGTNWTCLLAKDAKIIIPTCPPYNAVGDGVADDTTAITTALDAVTGRRGHYFFPAGRYKITSSLNFAKVTTNKGFIIEGQGKENTVIEYTGSGAAIVLNDGTGTGTVKNCTFRNLTIEVKSAATHALKLVDAPTDHCHFENVRFLGYNATTPTAIEFSGQTSCICFHTFVNIEINTFKRGLVLSGFANANQFDTTNFIGVDIPIDYTPVGSDTTAGDGNVVLNAWFQGTMTTGLQLHAGATNNTFINVIDDSSGATQSVHIPTTTADNKFIASDFGTVTGVGTGCDRNTFLATEITTGCGVPNHRSIRLGKTQLSHNASITGENLSLGGTTITVAEGISTDATTWYGFNARFTGGNWRSVEAGYTALIEVSQSDGRIHFDFCGNAAGADVVLTCTETFGFYSNGRIVGGKFTAVTQAVTCASSGDANPGALTIDPTQGRVEITQNDPDGCNITIAETNASKGDEVVFINLSANTATFADTAGVSELAGAFTAGQYDTLTTVYLSDRYVETARSNN